MSEVMMKPLAEAIIQRGGEVRLDSPVDQLVVENGKVLGVMVHNKKIFADHVVVATSLIHAQKLVGEAFGENSAFKDMLALPTMPAISLQIDLDSPSTEVDRTTFAPKTHLSSFAEQSRTTFRQTRGRISIDLGPARELVDLSPEEMYQRALVEAKKIGIDLASRAKQYRVVVHRHDFYCLAPGSEKLRPLQETPIPGLTLAGDYTKQRYLSTMEGAVYSGKLAAQVVLKSK
jgi:15-cis-phytoene desaturase